MAILFILAGAVFVLTAAAAGTTFTVDTTGDAGDDSLGDGLCTTATGECSLRAAIEELNALGPDSDPHQIHFDIPGAGPHVIAPTEALPRISVPVVIDGSTQPGAACPTAGQPADLRVVLDGSSLAGLLYATGLDLSSAGSGSHGSTIRGLVIGNFISGGITIYSDNNQIECNHIGLGVDGVSPMGNEYSGISIPSGQNTTVGGTSSEAQRNVISGNDGYGVYDSGDGGTVIANNYIGTTADGLNPLGNESGIYLAGTSNNAVGGVSPFARNVISGNKSYGLHILGAANNQVLGNYIGTGPDGQAPLPNGWDGIAITNDADNNTIGGTALGEGNRIAHNGDNGILLVEQNEFYLPDYNALRGNQIFGNGDLGIDLGYDGVDANDALDGDSGPNGHQNYPILSSVSANGQIMGTLESAPNQSYEIDFYTSANCDQSGYGEGEDYLSSASVTTDGGGSAVFDVTLNVAVLKAGDSVTATATGPNGSTSEFSPCAFAGGASGDGPAWITDCLGATPPPPAGNQFVYLPMLTSPSAPTLAGPADSQVAASANTLPLVDGGIVTGIDGVSLGAVSGTISTTLNISITHTTAPTQTILGDPQVHGAYYHVSADKNVLMCDQEKGFVLGLPAPGGAPRETLAIAALSASDNAINPSDSDWIILTGLYDEASQLMLVPLPWLTEEGITVVLVESTGFSSQRMPADSYAAGSEAAALSGSKQGVQNDVTFKVVCDNTHAVECQNNKEILTDFLELLYDEFIDLGFNRPWLRHTVTNIGILPEVVIDINHDEYEVESESCSQDEPVPLGQYYPYSKTARFCFLPPSPLSNVEMRGIRNHYFVALEFAYADVFYNWMLRTHDQWILSGMAAATEISIPSRMESSPDYGSRLVDIPLESTKLGLHLLQTQDYWVYTSRLENSGLALLRQVLEWTNAGTTEGLIDFYDGVDVFQNSYWNWVRNQVMLEDDIRLTDDEPDDPCTYQVNEQTLYWHKGDGQQTNAPGILEALTTHVIELQMAADRRAVYVEVRDPKTNDVSPFIRHKVYVDGETNCYEVTDGDRGFSEAEWDDIVAVGSRVFIVVANVNHEAEQGYEVVVETVSYTP